MKLLIKHIESTRSTDKTSVNLLTYLIEKHCGGEVFGPIECAWAEGFQEWDFLNGERVPNGHPIGFDMKINGQWQTIHFQDVRLSCDPWTEEELNK